MENILGQIEAGLHNGNYFLALCTTLALPDICAALESDNGQTTGARYRAWFDQWVKSKMGDRFDGSQCYAYRCGVLHQGTGSNPRLGYDRIVFAEPRNDGIVCHMNVMNNTLNIDVRIFCQNIVDSARDWTAQMQNNANYKQNIPNLMTRHPDGLMPYIVGVPVIG